MLLNANNIHVSKLKTQLFTIAYVTLFFVSASEAMAHLYIIIIIWFFK